MESFGWGLPVKRLAWACVELRRDELELIWGVSGKACSLGKVLT
jgi:hypothetical protein